MNEIAVGAAGLALILGGAGLAVALSNRRRMSVIPRDGNLIETLRRLDEDLANVETAVARLQPVVKSLGERMPGALRYASVVTFDANEDRTGHLSRSIALLNERRDGLVITPPDAVLHEDDHRRDRGRAAVAGGASGGRSSAGAVKIRPEAGAAMSEER